MHEVPHDAPGRARRWAVHPDPPAVDPLRWAPPTTEAITVGRSPSSRRSASGAFATALAGGLTLAVLTAVVLRSPIGAGHAPGWALDLSCDAAFGLAAACCLRLAGRGRGGWAWALQGLGLAAYVAADVHTQVVGAPQASPSLPDVLWLGFYAATFASLVLHVSARVRGPAPRVWLDGAIAGLATGAAVVGFAFAPLLTVGSGRPAAILTDLAYPVADLVLLVLLVASVHVAPPARWWARLQLGGLGCFLVADVSFLVGQAHSTWQEGTLADAPWLVGVGLLGASALTWRPTERAVPAGPQMAVPLAAAVVVTAVLLRGQEAELHPVSIALALAAIALTIARVSLAAGEIRGSVSIEQQRHVDATTGLPTRHALAEVAEALPRRPGATWPAMLAVRIDAFEDITGSLGRDAGDRVLRVAAERLEVVCRSTWTLARVGDDEFALYVPEVGSVCLDDVAAEVRQALLVSVPIQGIPLALAVTVGIAAAPDHGATAEALLASADLAVRQARRARTAVAWFRPSTSDPGLDRLTLEAELRAGLDAGQFLAHFQPQLDLRTREIIGVEALARWQHPTRGLLSPAVFLPLLARTGLAPELTEQMVDHVVDALVSTGGPWTDLYVGLNVSALDLASPAVVDRLERVLQTVPGAAGRFTIEITEDTVLVDRARAVQVLERMRRLGARIAVDDYGTGQASLSYLRDLPLDEVKLDRSFVDGVGADRRASAIARSTLDLAHELGLSVVAEGVEDEASARWLLGAGYDVGQGFHFARPVPLADLLRILGPTPTEAPVAREPRSALRVVGD